MGRKYWLKPRPEALIEKENSKRLKLGAESKETLETWDGPFTAI